ncbi:MAG: ParB/RepB/Spo0J family partition protein [Spirochaetaceae bacterium]|nr:ParB/RepB/Spo0J family partition protein [Spirochaetaceae bacterium]
MAKGGLGKGLSALIRESEESEQFTEKTSLANSNKAIDLPTGIQLEENGTLSCDISLLVPNPHQPRVEFSQDSLQELADSIRQHGIIQPVTIETTDTGNFYIIAGERRTRAAKLAGLKRIPIQLKKYDEEHKLEVALIENIQRENLNPVEEAQAYQKLMEMSNLSQEEVSKRVGKKRSTVANSLRLLKLPEDMQTSLVNGQISAGHARAILSVINPSDQRILFARIIGGNLSVRAAEEYATELNNGNKVVAKKTTEKNTVNKDPDLADLEQQFIDKLGTKVSIKGNLQKGSIVIEYFSSDDLDRLYNLIKGE